MQSLIFSDCTAITNIEDLRGHTGRTELSLSGCSALQDVDALRGLSALKHLYLNDCTSIQLETLRQLGVALPNTSITYPNG